MASGYRNNISQYVREEMYTITRELQEQLTFDNRNSTYPSHSSEHRYTENTTWVSYDHGESHIIEHRSNNFQTTQNNDTNIFYESYHQNFVGSFDHKNLTVDSNQETSNNTSSDFQYEEFTFEDLINDSECESDNYTDSENNNTSCDFQCEEHTFENPIDNSEYQSNDHVDPEISTENSENSEDQTSSHDDYEYSENSEDYYLEDNYEYSEDSEDYYYEGDDD